MITKPNIFPISLYVFLCILIIMCCFIKSLLEIFVVAAIVLIIIVCLIGVYTNNIYLISITHRFLLIGIVVCTFSDKPRLNWFALLICIWTLFTRIIREKYNAIPCMWSEWENDKTIGYPLYTNLLYSIIIILNIYYLCSSNSKSRAIEYTLYVIASYFYILSIGIVIFGQFWMQIPTYFWVVGVIVSLLLAPWWDNE